MEIINKKIGTASNGQVMHYSVGALIERDGKFLMIKRKNPPPGYAGLAGHIDEGETPEQALEREVREESGLEVIEYEKILSEEILWNYCKSGPAHFWHLYKVSVSGESVLDQEEADDMGWFSREELADLELEDAWRYWLEKLEIIPKKKKIAICGSMKFLREMEDIKSNLEARNFIVKIPETYAGIGGAATADDSRFEDVNNPIWQIKNNAILAHFRKILFSDAIIVVNHDKNGIENYVGGNTLMEIAFAEWYAKKIYFLRDIPAGVSYREELHGLRPIVLNDDLSKIDF